MPVCYYCYKRKLNQRSFRRTSRFGISSICLECEREFLKGLTKEQKHEIRKKKNQERDYKYLKFWVRQRLTTLFFHSLENKKKRSGIKFEERLGYSIDDFINHFSKLFKKGMNWDRFRHGIIHIDHIKPVSLFKFENDEDEEFKKCWALNNLQPLWAKENLSKCNREKLSTLDNPL